MGDAMSNVFFLVVGIIIAGIGLLLIMAKVFTYIQCTVPINATVVRLEKDYTQMASFRTLRVNKYRVNSQMNICCSPKNPELIRFVGHPFPLPLGLVFLLIGAVLIFCFFL